MTDNAPGPTEISIEEQRAVVARVCEVDTSREMTPDEHAAVHAALATLGSVTALEAERLALFESVAFVCKQAKKAEADRDRLRAGLQGVLVIVRTVWNAEEMVAQVKRLVGDTLAAPAPDVGKAEP
jgi:hypothetical protein